MIKPGFSGAGVTVPGMEGVRGVGCRYNGLQLVGWLEEQVEEIPRG